MNNWQEVDEGFYINDYYPGFGISDNASVYLKPEVRENTFTVLKDDEELKTVATFEEAQKFVKDQA